MVVMGGGGLVGGGGVVGGGWHGNSYPVTHFSIFQICLSMQDATYRANPRLHPRQICLYEPSSSEW